MAACDVCIYFIAIRKVSYYVFIKLVKDKEVSGNMWLCD